ncbi:DUF5696 domain-containing protein [Paenibacillus sp.]|uniref:DUF5696 domain-containing protein n=1 Tax=Paenibacillus sp. TaxID=58172 RepID=UPI002811FD91|nr:DUF5696 domain-containing protein [Paenibacillus sp.]
MLRRIWPTSVSTRLLIVLAMGLLTAGSLLFASGRWDRLPGLQEMGIDAPPGNAFPVFQGDPWVAPPTGPDGFAEVAQNRRFALYVDPKTSQIAVRNKESGFLWRSNPPASQIEKETVKGALLENLQSPFILEYVAGASTRRIQSNSLDPKLNATYVPIRDGIQITYDYGELNLSFAMQYVLTEAGFELRIPDAGLKEAGEMKLFSLNPLPYFGAVAGKEEEGYLFVPDGPGGIIRYDSRPPAHVRGYDFAIYGDDPAHLKEGFFKPKREPISYPVFGLARGDEAYAAIVSEGKYNASIRALPSGIVSSYHSLSVNFPYRQEYGRRVSGLTDEKVKTIEAERASTDRRVEYRLLHGDEADYVGMAHAYRQYLEDNDMLPERLAPTERIPLHLSLIGGGMKPKFGGYRYEPATTFRQAERIVEQLLQEGVANLRITFQGWQRSGRASTDQRLPIAKDIGGTDGARAFVSTMKEKGIPVLFEDTVGWKRPEHSDFSMRTDGVRAIDSTVLQGRFRFNDEFTLIPGVLGDFIVHPAKAIRGQKEVIDALGRIGASGIHYVDGPGNLLYSDYNADARLSRADTAYYYSSLLRYTKNEFGSVGVKRGYDYALKYAELVEEFPLESSYDLIVDETVPFYPIAVHGAVPYTSTPGNLRNQYDLDLLKAIEYGAIPSFKLTYAPSRALTDTDYGDVYSSEFAVWKDRIAAEYAKFDSLAAVYHQRIEDHERAEDGVFVTTYEDGTKVTVDYNAMQFYVKEGGGEDR